MNYYSYDYGIYGDSAASRTEEGIFAFLIVYLVILMFSAIIGLVFYLLQASGLYKMGKTVGISAPWMAYIPVVNLYAMGKIAETPVNGKKTLKYSTILLLLQIATCIITFAFIFFAVATGISAGFEELESTAVAGGIFFGGFIIGYFALMAVAIALTVFQYIAVYKIFKIFAPDNAVIYLILSLFVSAALPIIIFVLRNKPVHGYGQGQVPPIGTPGFNPAYAQQNYNPYGYNQTNYTPGNFSAQQGAETQTQNTEETVSQDSVQIESATEEAEEKSDSEENT